MPLSETEISDLKSYIDRLTQTKLAEQNANFATKEAQYNLDTYLYSLKPGKTKNATN